MKILAVEDDAVSRAVLRQALRRLGHETVEAADGEAAWEALQIEPFRVVVSDWMMPRTDGLELCRRIRQRPDAEYIYFILLTSRDATEENQREATDAGVDDFLTKPLDLPELWTRLRVAERILRFTKQVRQLEEMLPICSYCKKSATTKTTGSRLRVASASAPAATSAIRCVLTATSGSWCPSSRS